MDIWRFESYIKYQEYLESLRTAQKIEQDLAESMKFHDRKDLIRWCSETSNALLMKCECKLLSAEKAVIRRYLDWKAIRNFVESDKDIDEQHRTMGRITFQILQLVLRIKPEHRQFLIDKLIKTLI